MEQIIVVIVNALGGLGKTGINYLLDKIEVFVTKSTTAVDNAVFYKVVEAIQSWEPKNPPVE